MLLTDEGGCPNWGGVAFTTHKSHDIIDDCVFFTDFGGTQLPHKRSLIVPT